ANSQRSGSLEIPPREGDVFVFGRPPGDDVNADRWKTNIGDAAPYIFAEIAAGPVTFVPGLRFDAFLLEGSQTTPPIIGTTAVGFTSFQFGVDPRLQIHYKAHH